MKDNRFVKKLTNNFGLKLLAFAIAFALWLVVVNYNDPVTSCTYSGIPVEIVNASSLTIKGKVYEVLNNTDTISVTISGKRTVVESIDKNNIKAVADINNLTLMDTVEIQVSTNKNFDQLDSIKSDTTSLELSIEDLAVTNLPVQVEVTGEVADGYIIGDITTNQNTIKVSGPASAIEKIQEARLIVDVEGRTSDMSTAVDVVLYDNDGVAVEKSNISSNVTSINVSVAVLQVKAVDIFYSYSGTPGDGYAISGDLSGDISAVYIAGKANAIEGLSSITVPPTAINVEGKTDTFNTTIDLGKYLPDGIRFADSSFDGKVAVTVSIAPTVTRTLNVPLDNISLINIPEGYEAQLYVASQDVTEGEADENEEEEAESLGDVKIKVITEGILADYSDVKADDIEGFVDVAEYLNSMGGSAEAGGIYQMEIQMELPGEIRQKEVCYAAVKIASAN